MSLPEARLREAVLEQCTAGERRSCVAYVTSAPVLRGTTVRVPGLAIEFSTDGYLAFVDLDPMAHWGHRCRYVRLDGETGAATNVDAQFPPFSARPDRDVRLAGIVNERSAALERELGPKVKAVLAKEFKGN